ncbi:hypothetical protein ACEN2J_15595 [Pseudorhodobacter sp. W20_MBD10_FR17]|uniref:hypothetical protein n=1 Tax=Pseudorhodobacter sp. W20_MBD10_FR17 TaxID=3240266 RepID=UPI003F9659E1
MTDSATPKATNGTEPVHANADTKPLTGLFDEMQALMAVMPGMVFDQNTPVATEEEIEAMFDNMPL